ncbi:MAG: N-acetylgalactosamine-6-sulfatase, partial [Rikenellaceae bacterium]
FPEGTGSRAVRMGKWKAAIFDIRGGNDQIELYDLEADIREQHDVAAEHPEVVAQIREIMDRSHVEPINPKFKFF